MKITEVCAYLNFLKAKHGDVEVHAFPGWDTSYPVTQETIDYYSSEITGTEPHILITGSAPDR